MVLSREEFLKRKIEVFRKTGSSTDTEEAELAELARLYPPVLELPDLEWNIDGVLPKHGITGIGGLTDAGKTTFGLQLCHSLLSGEPCFDIQVKETVERIVYACLDQSPEMLKDQVKRMLPMCPSLGQLRVVSDLVWNIKRQKIAGLEELIVRLMPQVIVIDALNAIVGEADENAAMGPLMRELRRLTDKHNVSFIILHQFRKPPQEAIGKREPTAQDFRGSTEIGAKAEVLLALRRNGWEVKVTSVKAKSSNKVQLNLLQDPESLVYRVSMTRQERITKLVLSKMPVAKIVEVIHGEYGGNKESIRRSVYRTKERLEKASE